MKYNGDAKIIKAKPANPDAEFKPVGESSDLFTDEPVRTPWEKEAAKNAPDPEEDGIDYEPAPETEMDFMTEEEEKEHRKGVIIGALIGLLIAGLLIGGYIYHNQSGKIKGANVSTTVTTEKGSQKYGSLEPTQNTTRTYKTQQLTVHKDEKGVWRSYAGLDKTVGYTGVVGNDTGWWYVENDVINFKFNGIAENDYGSWLVENGKVNSKFTGNCVYNGRMYRIQEGMVIGNEPLTNRATTRAPTTAPATTVIPANVVPVNPTQAPTTAHSHSWIAIYDGDPVVQTGVRGASACRCLDCGQYFANAGLLESHVTTSSDHQPLKKDSKMGGLDESYIVTKDEVGDSDVIVDYTNGIVKYKCTICGKETTNVNETDYIG